MPPDLIRRRAIFSLLGGAATLAGWPAAHAAAASGKVYCGFASTAVAGLVELLTELRGHYQPELDLAPTMVPGNAGARAMELVLGLPADGGAVLFSPSGPLTLLLHLRKLPTVDPVHDFRPVASLGDFSMVLMLGPAVPAEITTVKAYLDWVERTPGSNHYGVPALGIPAHMCGMEMARTVELPLRPVAYQGLPPMLKDLIAGGIPAAFGLLGVLPQLSQDRRLRMLGVTSSQRWPGLPDLPTLHEQGAMQRGFVESHGLFVSAKTPQATVDALNAAVRTAQRTPLVTEALRNSMTRLEDLTPDQYAQRLQSERAEWAALISRERYSLQS